jgi:outer membrane receptor protein involved in Fe transport
MDWYYQSKVHYLPPEVTESVQDGYHLLNARLGYGFLDDRAELAFFARNLTDETVFGRVTSVVPIFGFLSRFYQPPRNFGGEVRYRF